MTSTYAIVLSILLLIDCGACQDQYERYQFVSGPETVAPTTPARAHVEVPTTGVHTITLPTIDTDLPAGPGKMTLLSACTMCHSPRYVTMQPNFSKKKWTDEVDKMKKVYGAPILDEQVEPIVKYLVAIRGNGQ